MQKSETPRKARDIECATWDDVRREFQRAGQRVGARRGECMWYRGSNSMRHRLSPSLMWKHDELGADELDWLEQDLFFEFQARARELHERGLSDWDYLFFMRHHGMPTRILDWTDSFGVALYFALDKLQPFQTPCVWVLNPFELNERTSPTRVRDLLQPKYLGLVKDEEFWDYGELLVSPDDWLHDDAVAIYPLQISDRMRAQRGWFTMHGNHRTPIEEQAPDCVVRLVLGEGAVAGAREFLEMTALKAYTIYPDLDNLGIEVYDTNIESYRRPGERNDARRDAKARFEKCQRRT